MVSISLLGDFRIRHDEVPVTGFDSPRLQSLLAYLLLHREAPQSRAHLSFLFWPDTNEAQARTNLRNLLHHLRRALPSAESYLDADVQTLQWRADASVALDVADFSAALARSEQATKAGDAAAAREALERAVTLYRGDLLPSCYDDWIMPLRESLRQAYLGALERLVRIHEEQRDYGAAITNAQRLLRHDPVQEATYRDLLRLHALNGDRAGALRVYHTCATVLRRELDVDPSVATREAYEQLLGAETRRHPTPPAATAFSPMVGRQKEWLQMLRAWRAVALGGEPHVVTLRGEAGIGKTRLLEELLQWAARQGISIASAHCYAVEGALAYAPVTAWLRTQPLASLEDVWLVEVARLLPEVLAQRPNLPRPRALIEAWQRECLLESLSRAIVGLRQPLLLTIDDLQWCDRDTLELLHFLLRFDREARLLVVGTYRPEEINDRHPLLSSLQRLRLEGRITELELQPLDETATRILATHVAGRDLDAATASLLYRETEGNPLFIVEMVRAGLHLRQSRIGDGLPPKVQAVLEQRLAQLSPAARELAGLTSTIGREFSFRLLAATSGGDEDTLVRELDELWQRRIVREHGADAYDFSHDKLREVAYCSMSAARRRLMHRKAAQALEALHAADLGPVSHQVAAHYERAGLPAQAVPHYLRAAEVARQVYANEEAIALLRRGLALVEDGGLAVAVAQDVIVQLYEALGDVLELKAQYERALQAFQNALPRVLPEEGMCQARLHRKMSAVMREQGLYSEALTACNQAEVALGEEPDTNDSPWWREWVEVQVTRVWAHYWLAQWPEMGKLVTKAQPVVQQHGSAAIRARFWMACCLMNLRRDRYSVSDEMVANSREALAASEEWGNLKSRVESLFELGFLLLWRRELDEAEEKLEAALQLAEVSEYVPFWTLSLTYLTVLYRFRGQMDAALSYAMRSQEVAKAAQMPDYVAAAEGNLAWVAWREGDLAEAESRSRAALERWRGSALVYPFWWMGLWPLVGVALARGQEEEAWAHVGALLEATQQRLPDALNDPLQAALEAKAAGYSVAARTHLSRAVKVAREMGYM